MKKLLLPIIGMAFAYNAHAQISLTRADFPKPTANSPLPDSVMYTNVNTGTATAHLSTGANFAWNESTLGGAQAYQNFVAVSGTPTIFQFTFLGSDYAQPLIGGGGLAGGALSDAYEYYDYANNNNRLQIRGFGGYVTIPGVPTALPVPAVYSSPDILFNFPMTFGNSDSSVSGFTVTIPTAGLPLPIPIGDITIKRNQKRVNEVDGWGTLTLANGASYNVLRHVSKINRIDSLKTALANLGFPSQPVEYRWLGEQKKIPVMQINGTRANGNVTITNVTLWGSVYPAATSDFLGPLSLSVYPNPAREALHINCPSGTGPWSLQLFDVMGRRVAQFGFTANSNESEMIPLNGLAAGQYALHVQRNGKQYRQLIQVKP
jgi:hypothetical protein